jgi:copper chaperone
MERVLMTLAIDGMHCQKCVERVRNAIDRVDGARAQKVEVGSATVEIDASREAQVLAAVREAGYEARESG